MYAIHLPEHIPASGSLGGPPLPSAYREFACAPFDIRSFCLDDYRINRQELAELAGDCRPSDAANADVRA
jgi:hypothetical protein